MGSISESSGHTTSQKDWPWQLLPALELKLRVGAWEGLSAKHRTGTVVLHQHQSTGAKLSWYLAKVVGLAAACRPPRRNSSGRSGGHDWWRCLEGCLGRPAGGAHGPWLLDCPTEPQRICTESPYQIAPGSLCLCLCLCLCLLFES